MSMTSRAYNFRIGVIAPKQYEHFLALTSVERSFQESFPFARLYRVDQVELESTQGLMGYDIVVLPPSHGDVTPYEYFFNNKATNNICAYARKGAVAAFCSGAYAVIGNFSYTYSDGMTKIYRGYAPLIDIPAHGPEDADFQLRDGNGRFSDTRIMPVFNYVSGKPNKIDLCYAGGPAFDAQALQGRADVRALSAFESGNISILARTIEKGIVIAFGSLPEIRAKHMPSAFSEWVSDMKIRLERSDLEQEDLWCTAMEMLSSRSLTLKYPHDYSTMMLRPS